MIGFLSCFLYGGNSNFLGITGVFPIPPQGLIRERMCLLSLEGSFAQLCLHSTKTYWMPTAGQVLGRLHRGSRGTQIRSKCQQNHRWEQHDSSDSMLSESILGFTDVASYTVWDEGPAFASNHCELMSGPILTATMQLLPLPHATHLGHSTASQTVCVLINETSPLTTCLHVVANTMLLWMFLNAYSKFLHLQCHGLTPDSSWTSERSSSRPKDE